jgi:hypothetical protein
VTGFASTRHAFLLAVALIAAAIADPIVESISNAGIVGGYYRDDNHTTVLPALLVGGVFVIAMLVHRWRETFRSIASSSDWLAGAAKSFSDRPPSRDLPYVFLLQMGALFGMESIEQIAAGGHLLGGTIWLGGPILFSLFAHALVGAACLASLGSFMRALLRTVASLVRSVLRFVWLAIVRAPACSATARNVASSVRHQWDAVRYSCGRAPPLLHTPA